MGYENLVLLVRLPYRPVFYPVNHRDMRDGRGPQDIGAQVANALIMRILVRRDRSLGRDIQIANVNAVQVRDFLISSRRTLVDDRVAPLFPSTVIAVSVNVSPMEQTFEAADTLGTRGSGVA